MRNMFYEVDAPVLDLSSFVLNDNVSLDAMFLYTSSKTGYAKDAVTAAKFNNKDVTNIGSGGSLTFIVKQ